MPRIFKYICCLVILTSLFTVAVISTNAQETSINQAQKDYTYEFSKYRDAAEKFSTAKSSYLTFKTATAKEQAFVATKAYLNQVTSVYSAYFSIVRIYAATLDWQNEAAKYEQLVKILEDMDTYFASQKQQITDTKTLEDLALLSQQMKQKITGEINPQLNYITASYDLQNAKLLFDEFEIISQELNNKKQSFVGSAILLNWQTEVASIKTNSQTALNSAQLAYDALVPNQTAEDKLQNIQNLSSNVKSQLRRSKTLFLEAVRFF